MMESSESTAREIARLHAQGRTVEALSLARGAAERFTQSALAQANLGFLLLTAGDYAGAREAYERALLLAPGHPEARRGLTVARRSLGEEVRGDSVSVMSFTGSGRAIELLVLLTLGRGNVVTEELFDPALVRVTKLAVELHPEHEPLPAHDLAFNAIGDPDSSAQALELTATLLAADARPILNGPRTVMRTGRVEQAQLLSRLPGVRAPKIRRIAERSYGAIEAPVLLRVPGFHAGEHFERVQTRDDLERALSLLPPGDLFAIEFIDTRDAQGRYEKYRVVAIDGVLYPVHLAISREWKVHYFSSEMAASSEFRERERRFLEDPRGTVGARAWAALEAVARSTGLQYAGIDFALDRQGDVVVFECNATMAVRHPPEDAIWAYRRSAVDAVMAAISAMLRRYSSARTFCP